VQLHAEPNSRLAEYCKGLASFDATGFGMTPEETNEQALIAVRNNAANLEANHAVLLKEIENQSSSSKNM